MSAAKWGTNAQPVLKSLEGTEKGGVRAARLGGSSILSRFETRLLVSCNVSAKNAFDHTNAIGTNVTVSSKWIDQARAAWPEKR